MDALLESFETAPIVEKEGGYSYLVHPISNCVPTLQPELLREVVVAVVQATDLSGVDKIVTPEAMGIHISTAVSLSTDVPLVVVRKREYGLPGEVSLAQETGYSESEMYVNDVGEGDRVLLLDDILSTGGTLKAIHTALEETGAEVVDTVVVIRKLDTESVPDLPSVTSLVDIRVGEDDVEVVRTADAGT